MKIKVKEKSGDTHNTEHGTVVADDTMPLAVEQT